MNDHFAGFVVRGGVGASGLGPSEGASTDDPRTTKTAITTAVIIASTTAAAIPPISSVRCERFFGSCTNALS